MPRADLTHALCRAATFVDTNLREAILHHTDLNDAVLTGADITNCEFKAILVSDLTVWTDGTKPGRMALDDLLGIPEKVGLQTPEPVDLRRADAGPLAPADGKPAMLYPEEEVAQSKTETPSRPGGAY